MDQDGNIYKIAAGQALAIIMLLYLLLIVALWGSNQREVTNCSSFITYADAFKSYKAGNKKLDQNHDGYPCEKQFPNHD